jgi:hypothetical protein
MASKVPDLNYCIHAWGLTTQGKLRVFVPSNTSGGGNTVLTLGEIESCRSSGSIVLPPEDGGGGKPTAADCFIPKLVDGKEYALRPHQLSNNKALYIPDDPIEPSISKDFFESKTKASKTGKAVSGKVRSLLTKKGAWAVLHKSKRKATEEAGGSDSKHGGDGKRAKTPGGKQVVDADGDDDDSDGDVTLASESSHDLDDQGNNQTASRSSKNHNTSSLRDQLGSASPTSPAAPAARASSLSTVPRTSAADVDSPLPVNSANRTSSAGHRTKRN